MSEIRSEFHNNVASEFIDSVFYKRSNLYYYLGKINPWTSDSTPDQPYNTVKEDVEIRDNIVYAHQISPNEVSMVTKNYTWEADTTYAQWDHTQNMSNLPFYCVNSEFNVYKCLNNNNGQPSTIEPSGNSLQTFKTADNYVWKYMYNVPAFKRRKFLSNQFLPVQKALSDGFYSRGAVERITVIDGGFGYTSAPQATISIEGDGSGAILVPIVSKLTGSIVEILIQNEGSDYTFANLSISAITGTGISGIYGNPTAVISAVIYEGKIVNVVIEDPGTNYSPDTSTSIIVTGDGTDAAFTPIVSNNSIIGVIVDNPGIGYSFMDLTIQGTGTGANLQAVLAASDFLSDQALVEQSTVDGAIYTIVITNPGDNYTENSTISITGDGQGCMADIVVSPEGYIEKINVINAGSGYTYANVVITDPNRDLPNEYTNAEAYAIFPPIGGHGFNAVKELYANSICIFNQLKDDNELLLMGQDYRQYGILANPTTISSLQRAKDNSYFFTFKLSLNNMINISVDDLMISNSTYYRVVRIYDTQIELQQLSRIYRPVSEGDLFYRQLTPEIQHAVISVDSSPIVNKYSGDLLYVTNADSFMPTKEQLVSIRTYITF